MHSTTKDFYKPTIYQSCAVGVLYSIQEEALRENGLFTQNGRGY